MKNKYPVFVLSTGLLVGGGAGLLMTLPSSSNAVGETPSLETDTTISGADSAGTVDVGTDTSGRPDPSTRLNEALAPLVADGTITQAQADKVIEALIAARPERGDGPMGGGHGEGRGPGGKGGPGEGMGRGAKIEVITATLGVTAEELRTELQAGKSIADVAAAKGVDVKKVIDAVVADASTRLAEKVTAGDLTQAEADTRLTELTTRVTEMVNTPGDELRGPGHGGRNHGDDDDDATGGDPTDATTETTLG